MHGVLPGTSTETCTAGAGSLLLEFGILSRLLNDPIFENCARRANQKLWQLRHKETGLLGLLNSSCNTTKEFEFTGNSIDVNTSEWKSFMTGEQITNYTIFATSTFLRTWSWIRLILWVSLESVHSVWWWTRVGNVRRIATKSSALSSARPSKMVHPFPF